MDEVNRTTRAKQSKDGKVSLLSGILKSPCGTKFYREPAGNKIYYYNLKTKERLQMAEVESKVIDDITEVMLKSGELRKQIERTILKVDSAIQRQNDRLGRLKDDVREKTKVLNGFSDRLRELALSPSEDVTNICKLLLDEKEKVEFEIDSTQKEMMEV